VHGPIILLYALLALYVLQILVPLLLIGFAWARQRVRRTTRPPSAPLGRTV